MVTIKEIAQKSGYSQATVSRLLNNDEKLSISDTARSKILQVAQELGYQRRDLKYTFKRKVALLFRVTETEELQDVYFNSLKKELLRQENNFGVQLSLYHSVSQLLNEAQEFCGFIGVGTHNLSQTELQQLHEKFSEGVFVDTNPAPKLFDSVQPNLSQTILDGLRQLTLAGKQKIGFIGGQGIRQIDGSSSYDERHLAFKTWTQQMQIYDPKYCFVSGEFGIDNGYCLGQEIVVKLGKKNLPDAFIVASDALSIGVLQAFNEAEILVPHDVSLISINNIKMAQYVSPPLTTYAIDQAELSRMALMLLSDSFEYKRRAKMHVYVDTTLVVRKSFIPNEEV